MSINNSLDPVEVNGTAVLIYESRYGTVNFPTILTIDVPSGSTVYVGPDANVTTVNGISVTGTSAEQKMIKGGTLYGITSGATVIVPRMVDGAE